MAYQRQVTFGEAIVKAIQENYCNFSGRASRSEYWWYLLAMFALQCALSLVTFVVGDTAGTIISGLIGLALLLPGLGLCVRRLHDVGHSGWWLLIALTGIGAILLLVWYIMPSQAGANEYGDEPNMVY